MVNYCPNCGRGVGINDAYCPGCGISLNAASQTTSAAAPVKTEHAALLDIAKILTGLWAAIAVILAALILFGSNYFGDGAFLISGSILGIMLLISAICAGLAARNIKNRKHATLTIILLIISGLLCLGWFPIMMAIIMAAIVMFSAKDFS